MAAPDIDLRKWVVEACCGAHIELPWTEPGLITLELETRMATICHSCPVRRHCAADALRAGPPGGFYAGVKIPWHNDFNKGERMSARRRLKGAVIFA